MDLQNVFLAKKVRQSRVLLKQEADNLLLRQKGLLRSAL
jgi:hypothetical protein